MLHVVSALTIGFVIGVALTSLIALYVVGMLWRLEHMEASTGSLAGIICRAYDPRFDAARAG